MIADPHDAGDAPPEFQFSEDAVLAVFQARHEALHLGATDVTPGHLALGILKALPVAIRHRLVPDPAGFTRLCRRLGASTTPAPAIPEDVEYTAAARRAFGEARAEAGSADIAPLHLLVGVLVHGGAAETGALEEAGLSLVAVRRWLRAGWGGDP